MQEKDEAEKPACGLPKVDDLLKEMEATVAASRLEDVMRERDRIQLKVAMRGDYGSSWEEEQWRRQHMQEMEYQERRYRLDRELDPRWSSEDDRRDSRMYMERDSRMAEERYRRDMLRRYSPHQEYHQCNINCKCGPCRDGDCGNCTVDQRREFREKPWLNS